jgi:hypothetical protein
MPPLMERGSFSDGEHSRTFAATPLRRDTRFRVRLRVVHAQRLSAMYASWQP